MEDRLPELPRGWVWTAVGEISKDIHYGYTESSSEKQIGPKFLRITDIQNNSVNWESVPYCKIEEFEKGKYLLKDGDLVFARTGATVGKSFLIRGNIPEAVFASYLIRIILDKNIDRFFISNFFQSIYYWSQIHKGKIGIGQPNVNAQILSHITIPLPPLPEQHHIVAKIEELFTRLDAGVEALKKIKAQLKRYRQAVLKWAFEGKLTQEWREAHKGKLEPASAFLERIGEQREKDVEGKHKELLPLEASGLPGLPEGWVWTRLELCSDLITKGESPNWQGFNYVDNGIPFVRSENVLWGSIDLSDVAKIPEEFHKKLKRSQLKPNDVLINLVGASIGRCGIFSSDGEANINQAVALVRVNEALIPSYLMNLLLSPRMQKEIQESKVETARPNISLKDLRLFTIPLPSPSEQQKIVEEIENRLSIADNMERVAEQSLKQSERLRQSILKRAFEGKLVPQDPTDEPAEKLLDRIKEEKAKQEGENRKEKKQRNKKSKQMELI
jgi:type I restriction enzyme S subunit